MPNDIGITLKDYRNAVKMSVKQISDILTSKGFKASESTIYSWENGNSQPTPGALLTMCKAYGINDVLTAFGYDGYKKDGSLQLNIKEVDMVEKYRILDDHGKDIVDTLLEKEYSRCKEIAKVIELDKSYLEPVAAHERTDIEVTEEMKQYDDAFFDE